MQVLPTIGFVGNSLESLAHMRVLARDVGCRLVTIHAGLEDALEPVRHLVAEEAVELLIARRGTAHMLREHCSVPVMDLPDTSASHIRAVKNALHLGRRIGITIFHRLDYDLSLCEELCGVKLHRIIYRDRADMAEHILEAKALGIEVIVGGGVTQMLAEQYGIPSVPLVVSNDITGSILENAMNMVYANRKEVERRERYRTILNSVSEGIIAMDAVGRIAEVNQTALRYLKAKESDLLGHSLLDILPNQPLYSAVRNGKRVSNILENLGQERFVLNAVPILANRLPVGAVCTLQPAARVIMAGNEARRSYSRGLTARYALDDFWHADAAMADIINKVRLYAACDSMVLITGETGTGKEIIAQGIHRASPRQDGPFVSVNCSAMPEQLLESELFGYAEGAFTGSRRGGKPGMFELAHQGTLFLDEIGSIPEGFQMRLLRVLQEKEVMRLGSGTVVPVDVRVVAATNRRLAEEVRQGRLREDLFFRLSVLTVTLPPLRQRRDDIPLIFQRMLDETSQRHGRPPLRVPPSCVDQLRDLPWPGNVRQVYSFVEHLVVLCQDGFDDAIFTQLYQNLRDYSQERDLGKPPAPAARELTHELTRELTRENLRRVLAETGQSRSQAARVLGVSRTTLWRLAKRWEL